MNTMPYNTKDLANLYDYLSSGHFFDKATMRFFNSRLTSNFVRVNNTLGLFITTEKAPMGDTKRMATIRLANLVTYERESDGRLCQKITIETLGEFNSMTLAQAKRKLAEVSKEWTGK